jgi:hypothetical protein
MASRAGGVVERGQGHIVNLGFTEQGDLVIQVQRRRLCDLLEQALFREGDKRGSRRDFRVFVGSAMEKRSDVDILAAYGEWRYGR